MPPPLLLHYYEVAFAVTAFVVGAIVGSFLNVCVYRMPLGLSVNEPKRSFCPNCKAQIAWYHNLPIVGWLWLRGRCANCRQPIAVRYPLVELLTAVLFFLVWERFRQEWILVGPYWIFVSLLIVATFIDFDWFMIPDEITIGGTVAGVLLSLAMPQLMGVESHALGLGWSLVGAGAGYLTLRLVVEGGKLAFGRKRIVLPELRDFVWRRVGEHDAEFVLLKPLRTPDRRKEKLNTRLFWLRKFRWALPVFRVLRTRSRPQHEVAEEKELWSGYFNPDRPRDELVLHCDKLTLAGSTHANVVLHCFWDALVLDGVRYEIEKVETFSGRLREFVFPREAMGLGDVKFIAGIGAFLGWKAVFFTIATASMVGSVVGIALLLLGPKARSARIPFGPYLSVGAVGWMFAGPEVVRWYLGLMSR